MASDEFAVAMQALAEERYSGEPDRGFAHLAFQLSYPTLDFTDEQAEEVTAIDRPGDLGADGLYVDEEGEQVLLFQSKSSAALKDTQLHKDISDFVDVPSKLMNDEWVEAAHAEMRSLANEYREAKRKGYAVSYAFATQSRLADKVRSTFEGFSEVPGTSVRATLLLLDGDALSARYQKLQLGEYGSPTNVHFAVRRDNVHQPQSVVKVIYLTLPVQEYVNECKRYGMELFRFNPRLFLGANKVNSGIASTIKDRLTRKLFHLLNNGITAVCADFALVDAGEDSRVLNVEDFQVVNGCQTTMTLLENSASVAGESDCLIDVKVVASPGLRDLISQTTNTQTSILAEDAFANAEEQRRIRNLFKRHAPPYFYSPKRGEWDRQKPTEKRAYQDDRGVFGKHRKVTSKELAAVCLAIFGEPEAAKDKPRMAFERVTGENSSNYKRIFEVNNVAAQWLLPVELFRYINAFVKNETKRAREECPDDPDCAQAVRARVAAYGRFRMLHLAYGYLRAFAAEASDFISPVTSDRLLGTIELWAPNLLPIAFDAVVDAYGDAQERGESSGLREFFREKKHQNLVQRSFDGALIREERAARRRGADLPKELRLTA